MKLKKNSAIMRGIVDGNDDDTFGPNNSITREAFVKMLVTAMNKPVNNYGKKQCCDKVTLFFVFFLK